MAATVVRMDVKPLCAVQVWGNVCGQPGERRVTTGCVHEHLTTDVVCREHHPMLLAAITPPPAASGLVCIPCSNTGCRGCRVALVTDEPVEWQPVVGLDPAHR
jgi:hypothetical protein